MNRTSNPFSRALVALCAIATASGCYFYYPSKVPKLHGALVVEGEAMEMKVETRKEHYNTCMDEQIQRGVCELVDGKWMFPYNKYHVTVLYDGRTLTHAELLELAMPEYPSRVNEIAGKRAACKVSSVPSWLAVGVGVATAAVSILGTDQLSNDQRTKIYWGGAGATVGLALLSYPLGGFACASARALAGNMLNGADFKDWRFNELEEVAAMQKLVDDFNAKHASAAASRAGGSNAPE
jgi:hypothetical protein